MPELPEVETNRRELALRLTGKTLAAVQILSPKQFTGDPNRLIGATVTDVVRHGKIMAIALSTGQYLNIHLKMTGQMLFAPDAANAVFATNIPLSGGNTMPGRSTRIIIGFTDGSAVFFNDSRKFGWMKLTSTPEKPKAHDVLHPAFTEEYFLAAFGTTARPIKTFLLDQDRLAGVGNIYANEALYEAGINPLRPAKSLSIPERKHLYAAVKMIIDEGVKYRGSSDRDESYLLPDGSRGGYQHRFRVYNREGVPCKKCGTPIMKTIANGRSNYYCPHCQK